jgi:hypothetical protein
MGSHYGSRRRADAIEGSGAHRKRIERSAQGYPVASATGRYVTLAVDIAADDHHVTV